MHSACENPGSIRKPSITFGFPSRPETMMLLWSIIWELIFAIYGGHLPLHTGCTLQSPRLSFPLGDFCMKFSPSASFLSSCGTKNKERERKVVVFFCEWWWEPFLSRVASHLLLRWRVANAHVRLSLGEAPAFLLALSGISFPMLYSTYVYTLRSQGNVTTSYEYCAAKF